MSRKKSNILAPDKFDFKVLYYAIFAIVIVNFMVRLKIFSNVLRYDSKIIPTASNIFAYYKVVWIVFIAAALIALLAYRMYKYKQKPEVNYVLFAVGPIIIAAVVSYLLSPATSAGIWGMFSRNNGLMAYASLFLLAYILSNFRVKNKHLYFAVHSLNIVSLVLLIIAVFQFFGLNIMDSLWYKQLYVPLQHKDLIGNIKVALKPFYGTQYFWASSIFGQVNYFGAYCSIVYPIITAFALVEENRIRKISLIIGSVMLFVGTILAQSMGSVITLFMMMALIPISFVNKRNFKDYLIMLAGYVVSVALLNILTKGVAFKEIFRLIGQVLGSKLVVLVILMLIAYAFVFVFRQKVARYRYMIIAAVIILTILVGIAGHIYLLNNVVESNMGMLSFRGYIWYYANELIKDNFIFGYGPDNFYYNFPQDNPHKAQFMPNEMVDKPHNMYLQVILDTGIIGLAGFMFLLAGTMLKSAKYINIEEDIFKSTYFKALILVLFAYMLQGVVNDNYISIQAIVYMLIGLGASQMKKMAA